MQSLKQLIQTKNPVDKNKFVSREFQDYGYRLAAELGGFGPQVAVYKAG